MPFLVIIDYRIYPIYKMYINNPKYASSDNFEKVFRFYLRIFILMNYNV